LIVGNESVYETNPYDKCFFKKEEEEEEEEEEEKK
jgi:hypothetical protein